MKNLTVMLIAAAALAAMKSARAAAAMGFETETVKEWGL